MKRTRKGNLEETLWTFKRASNISNKGSLSVVLVLTRNAQKLTPPYDPSNFLTEGGGQVAGLGRSAVQSILADHGIVKVLAEEGGRTSRGNIGRMYEYVQLLNKLHGKGDLDLRRIEAWWIDRIKEHFSSRPLRLKADKLKSLSQIIADLMDVAYKRQQAQRGTMVAGAVMQHLVGAKLKIALPKQSIGQKGFSVADEQREDPGDFLAGDCVIHVTAAPTEALIRKCEANLSRGLRPIIITSESGVGGAKALAESEGLAGRIDVFELAQFVALNIYEWGHFEESSRPLKIEELLEVYNDIVEKTETDHSLKIIVG